MSALSEKIRKAREVRVEFEDAVGKKEFIVLRPTTVDMAEMAGKSKARAILGFIVGWSGVSSLDLYPGGDANPVEFDKDAGSEWLLDRIDILSAIADKAMDAYQAHQKNLEQIQKN